MDVKLPPLGEGADSGTVVSLLVKEGATVKKGQGLIELETGKAVAPIPSPADGIVKAIKVKEGDALKVGQSILELDGGAGGGGTAAPAPAAATAGRATAAPRAPRSAARAAAPAPAAESGNGEPEEEEEILSDDPAAGPYVRKLARELGLDLRVVAGSGPGGRIALEDLKQYIAGLRARALAPRAAPTPAPAARPAPPRIDFSQWGPILKRPLTPLRKAIAERMVESATRIPTVTQFDEADITALNALRKQFAPAYEAKGARLTLTSFILKAVASTLKKHPIFATSLDEAAGELVFKEYIHLGLAVDTEAGLLVPVIRDADKKDLRQLSLEVQELAARARDRKLSLAEMQGGTFTISNQGGIGGAHFTPIINLPEVAILGLGRGALKPVVREGGVEPRLLVPLGLTYDHRVIDGGAAARFIVDLAAAFEGFTEADVRL